MTEGNWRNKYDAPLTPAAAAERKRLQEERFPPIKYPVLDKYVTMIDGQEVEVTVYSGRSVQAAKRPAPSGAVKSTASSPNCTAWERTTHGLGDLSRGSSETSLITSGESQRIIAPPLDYSYFAKRAPGINDKRNEQ
jgi:hypothetical protein